MAVSVIPAPLSRADKISRTNAKYRVTEGNIAAIDFGTTSVSIAFTTKRDEKVNTLVLDHESQATRVPNAALLKRDGYQTKMVSFGSTARLKFIAMKAGEHAEHIYFERIKMLMRREKSIERHSLVKSFSGESFYLLEVIAFILQYLKDQLIDHLSRTVKHLMITDFDWVITVPAIWDARGKRMMREAAYLAGLLTESCGGIKKFSEITNCSFYLPDEINPDKLSLALEPESAALYSQEMIGNEIDDAGSMAAIDRPTDYMVIDIGGGTVDITAQTEVASGFIRVENVPTGNAWGGTQVNDAFSKLLQKLVDDTEFKCFLTSSTTSQRYTQNMAALNRMFYKEFEEQKTSFGQCKTETITINLPSIFTKFYRDKLIDGAEDMYGIEYDEDLDTLYLEKHVVESQLFGPAIEGIISCTLKAIDDNGCKVSTFYLVGGFGGCKYVHEKVSAAIEKLYQSNNLVCHVLVPPSPALAVATGAAMWRKNPEKVKTRRVDATYGIGCSQIFDADKHDVHYRYTHEETKKYMCDSVFKVFLEKGEFASVDQVITTTQIPHSSSQTTMLIAIYSTPNLGVQYIEDKSGKPTVTKIGQLVIDIPNPHDIPREKRDVDITMDFSGTEIQAKAKYRVTGEEVKTVCDFLSSY